MYKLAHNSTLTLYPTDFSVTKDTNSSSTHDGKRANKNVPAKIGGFFGACGLLAIAGLLLCHMCKKRRKKSGGKTSKEGEIFVDKMLKVDSENSDNQKHTYEDEKVLSVIKNLSGCKKAHKISKATRHENEYDTIDYRAVPRDMMPRVKDYCDKTAKTDNHSMCPEEGRKKNPTSNHDNNKPDCKTDPAYEIVDISKHLGTFREADCPNQLMDDTYNYENFEREETKFLDVNVGNEDPPKNVILSSNIAEKPRINNRNSKKLHTGSSKKPLSMPPNSKYYDIFSKNRLEYKNETNEYIDMNLYVAMHSENGPASRGSV